MKTKVEQIGKTSDFHRICAKIPNPGFAGDFRVRGLLRFAQESRLSPRQMAGWSDLMRRWCQLSFGIGALQRERFSRRYGPEGTRTGFRYYGQDRERTTSRWFIISKACTTRASLEDWHEHTTSSNDNSHNSEEVSGGFSRGLSGNSKVSKRNR